MTERLRVLLVAMMIGSIVVAGALALIGPGAVDRNQSLGFVLVGLGAIAVLGALVAAIRSRQDTITGVADDRNGAADRLNAASGPVGTDPLTNAVIVVAAVSEGGLFIATMGYAFAPTTALLAVGALHVLVFVVLLVTVNSVLP